MRIHFTCLFNFFLGIILLLSFISCKQNNKEDIVANKKSDTQKIESPPKQVRINIPGTHISVIPPFEFTLSSSFKGLQKGKASIVFYDLPDGDFYSNAETFSREKFESKGAKVIDFKVLKVNGYPAKYVQMQSSTSFINISLVFGDSTFSANVMAMYSPEEKNTEDDIKKAFSTITYDKELTIDPLAFAPFKLRDNQSVFKFSKSVAGVYIFTVEGKDQKDNIGSPFITLIPTKIDGSTKIKDVAALFLNSLKNNGIENREVKSTTSKSEKGIDSYEMVVTGSTKMGKTSIYLLILIANGSAMAVEGVFNSNGPDYLSDIKKFSTALKFK